MKLASRLEHLTVSLTLQISARAKELSAAGKNVIDLSCGEPDHPTPRNIKDAGIKAIEANFTKYTAASGIPELKKAIQKKLADENNLSYDLDQIVVSSGAKHSIANAIMTLIEPGDEVVIPEPCWLSYPELVFLAGGIPVYAETKLEDGFHLKPEVLAKVLTKKTKLVILGSPNNPTGAADDQTQIEAICEVLKNSEAIILTDEIYERLRYDGKKHFSPANIPALKERTIVVNGVSKCYSMTGWRIGYAAAHKGIALGMTKVQSQMTSSSCSISQKAAAEGLSGDQTTSFEMVKDFQRRRQICYEILRNTKGITTTLPEGAFYFFPDISSFYGKRAGDKVMKDSNDIAQYLLDEVFVATVPGSAFRAPNCLRISYANSDENVRNGVTQICQALSKLN